LASGGSRFIHFRMDIDAIRGKARKASRTRTTTQPSQCEWIIPTLGITLALTLAIGIAFLVGQQTPLAPDDMSAICRNLPKSGLTANCIALRSTVATEGATLIARWGIWISLGSLIASSGAIIGLIVAFMQGQRGIALATEANKIAVETAQTQARAYVVVEKVECKLDDDGQFVTKVTFQNSGQSPARRLRWLYNAHLVIIDANDERRTFTIAEEPHLERSHWRQDVPAGQSWTSHPLGLRGDKLPEIVDALDQAAFVAATVKVVADYQDVFGATHHEIACFQERVNPSPQGDPFTVMIHAHDDALEHGGNTPV
jgi:hypothetical protein